MSETIVAGILGAVITGFCGISLYLVKRICTCMCPGKCEIDFHCGKFMPENSPIRVLDDLYQEPSSKFYNSNTHVKALAVKNRQDNKWIVDIPPHIESEEINKAHIFRHVETLPNSGKHFLRVNIKSISHPEQAYFFIRRWTGGKNTFHESSKRHYIQEVYEGINIIQRDSFIDNPRYNVDKEQIGIEIKGLLGETVTCEITEAYYGEYPTNIAHSCCNKLQCWYRCFDSPQQNQEQESA